MRSASHPRFVHDTQWNSAGLTLMNLVMAEIRNAASLKENTAPALSMTFHSTANGAS